MTNAELIAKIRAEIERRKSLLTQHSKLTYDLILETFIKEYDDLISFLSALESEKPIPNDLEEASSKFATHTASNGVSVEFLEEKLSFQEGAKWQKEQDEILKVNYEGARTVYDNTVQHLQEKIDEKYELGKKDMKEQMLKEAVEGVLVDNVDGTQEICLHGNRYGDKVRIIIVKEDEKLTI